ncbi:MAG TPA: hypothetical protein VHZ24_22975, partial [Pirellulales bacterium]|nr:hypothetical protein [Pirellulales bacterium]
CLWQARLQLVRPLSQSWKLVKGPQHLRPQPLLQHELPQLDSQQLDGAQQLGAASQVGAA